MAINIDTLVHNEFSGSAIDQLESLTGKPVGHIKAAVERAIAEILDGFSHKAREEAGRQSLYEAARYCDDGLIDDPGMFFGAKDKRTALADSNNALGVLIGDGKRADIVEAVRSASSLSSEDAEMVTGYVTPGVLGVMKRQMLNGAVLDNSDGIGQMLLGSVTTASAGGAAASVDHTVPKSAPRQTTTVRAGSAAAAVASGGAAAASVHDNESDHSWLFRWAMPFLLLGGLVLSGVQNCGPKHVNAAAEARAQQLASMQTEADDLKGEVTNLMAARDEALSDRETAVAEIGRLQGELETANAAASDTSELDAATAEIASLKEQLAQPADTTELDAATAEIASLKEQLAQPADTSELDAANAEIASLKDQLSKSADNSALNAEILSLKDQLANAPAASDNSEIVGLRQSVGDSELKIALLEMDLGNLRESSAAAKSDMLGLTGERDAALREVEQLNTRITDLEAEVATANDTVAQQQEAISALEAARDSTLGKAEVMQANLDRAVDDATAKRKELVASRTELLSFKKSVEASDKKLAKVTKGRSAAIATVKDLVGKLRAAEAGSSELQGQIESEQMLVESERSKSKALKTRLDNAIAFSRGRGQELEEANAKLAKVTESERSKSKALKTRLDNAIAFSRGRGQELEEANTKLAKVTKGRSAAIKTVTDLAGKLRAAESGSSEFQGQLESERSKNKVLKTRLDNAIAYSRGRRQELADTNANLAKVTKGRGAAIKTVKDLVGKLRASESQLAEAQAATQAGNDQISELSATLADELSAAGLGDVTVDTVDNNQAVGITMGSSDLYRVGSATLSRQGVELLDKVGSIVAGYDDWRIDVEGHTDGQPIGNALRERFETNWELSTARATAAVRYLQSEVGISAEKMSIRGFGEHQPVDTNDTAEGREANRRIELILRK